MYVSYEECKNILILKMKFNLIKQKYFVQIPCFIGFNSYKRLNICILNKFYSSSTIENNNDLINVKNYSISKGKYN